MTPISVQVAFLKNWPSLDFGYEHWIPVILAVPAGADDRTILDQAFILLNELEHHRSFSLATRSSSRAKNICLPAMVGS